MEIKQRIDQQRLLIPELRKSLGILTLSAMDLRTVLDEELVNNPLLEEDLPEVASLSSDPPAPSTDQDKAKKVADFDLSLALLAKKNSLQDILLRQLGMFARSDQELRIGQEIIGNIDQNGYLKASLDEISGSLNVTVAQAEKVLKLIHKFEPPGIGARDVSECLLIQLDFANDSDPLIRKIVTDHLPDIAKKNYGNITKALKEPLEKIEPLLKKILKLDPKPGRNYSSENAQHIIPDATIEQKDDQIQVVINDSNLPILRINRTYEEMLEKGKVDLKTKEFLKSNLLAALELLKAISKRRSTLIKVIKSVLEVQQEAVQNGPSSLKPLTFAEIAKNLDIHETTVCRAVMNKYIRLPWGLVALKDLFPSHISDKDGQTVSSAHTKHLIKELIDKEDKKHPLSDQDIAELLANEKNLNISRRTVAKYREELKILSSTYRRER